LPPWTTRATIESRDAPTTGAVLIRRSVESPRAAAAVAVVVAVAVVLVVVVEVAARERRTLFTSMNHASASLTAPFVKMGCAIAATHCPASITA